MCKNVPGKDGWDGWEAVFSSGPWIPQRGPDQHEGLSSPTGPRAFGFVRSGELDPALRHQLFQMGLDRSSRQWV